MSFLTFLEQYECPRCNSLIANECVAGNSITDPVSGSVKRQIRAYCDHCDLLYQAKLGISDTGLLKVEEEPHVITDDKIRKSFMRRIDALRGDKQMATSK